jgi:hypothetical protein
MGNDLARRKTLTPECSGDGGADKIGQRFRLGRLVHGNSVCHIGLA